MYPVIVENDIVVIKKQKYCDDSNIAIVIINGKESTIKKIKKIDTGIILQSLNSNYEPLFYTHSEIKSIPIIIVGVVKELKRKF